jgi:hypothetical protein
MSICISFFGLNINPNWCETTAKLATNSGRKLHFYTIKEMYANTQVYPSKTSRKKKQFTVAEQQQSLEFSPGASG